MKIRYLMHEVLFIGCWTGRVSYSLEAQRSLPARRGLYQNEVGVAATAIEAADEAEMRWMIQMADG